VPAGTAERRCAAIVAELDIPEPFDLGRFLARLVLRRNRLIYLHPFRSGPGVPCGLWIGTADADHVFHEEGTTPWHKTHIVLHEIAHMLLGHDGGTRAWHGLARRLAPDVDPSLVRLVLGRSAYTSVEEREAETLASLILGQAVPPTLETAVGTGTAAIMGRLERTGGNGHRLSRGFRCRTRALTAAPGGCPSHREPRSAGLVTCPAPRAGRPGGKTAHDRRAPDLARNLHEAGYLRIEIITRHRGGGLGRPPGGAGREAVLAGGERGGDDRRLDDRLPPLRRQSGRPGSIRSLVRDLPVQVRAQCEFPVADLDHAPVQPVAGTERSAGLRRQPDIRHSPHQQAHSGRSRHHAAHIRHWRIPNITAGNHAVTVTPAMHAMTATASAIPVPATSAPEAGMPDTSAMISPALATTSTSSAAEAAATARMPTSIYRNGMRRAHRQASTAVLPSAGQQ